MFLSICCVYAAWVAKGFLLKFRQKGFWQESRETFEDNIVEECYNESKYWRNNEMAVMEDHTSCCTAQNFGRRCLGTLHFMQNTKDALCHWISSLVFGTRIKCGINIPWTEVLTWKFWGTLPWRHKNFGANSELPFPMNKTSQHKYTPWHQWRRQQQQASLPGTDLGKKKGSY